VSDFTCFNRQLTNVITGAVNLMLQDLFMSHAPTCSNMLLTPTRSDTFAANALERFRVNRNI
jgi:hypothetical protein